MTPKQRAAKSAAIMWADDKASQWLGMEIVDIDEGRATLAMTIRPEHCNGHGTCHGGISFSLADSAFAFACNSRNQQTVGQHTFMNYLAPGYAGDRLTATAREVSLTGRSGVYDVTVTNQNGTAIAEFRGVSRMIGGTHFNEDSSEQEAAT